MIDLEQYTKIKQEVAGRAEIMAVSKKMKNSDILPLLEAGHRLFGENRVDEAKNKWVELKKQYPDVKLHLIGHLQTNKLKEAIELFDSIDTLDNYDLADKIAKIKPKNTSFMIQVNTGAELQKTGVLPQYADKFISYCIDDLGINVTGLMCIPPQDEEPSAHFAFLKEFAKRHNLQGLSMGMSADYPLALQQGATIVRIGTLLFGERK